MFHVSSIIENKLRPVIGNTLDKFVNRNIPSATNHPIDFVILWVDCNDPNWLAEYQEYFPDMDFDPSRYRDMKILKYWFRSVEKYAPWVNRIYFVTNGQLPEWLDTSHPKLVHVKHSDFIPAEYLPTYSSPTIEFNIHRIKGLSEHFVLFNDDMFINGPVEPSYYFRNGLPIDNPIETIVANKYSEIDRYGIYLNMSANMHIINCHFNRREVLHNNWIKWLPIYRCDLRNYFYLRPHSSFAGIGMCHNEMASLKSTWTEIWDKVNHEIVRACRHKRRRDDDINIYLMRYWQLASNKWVRRYNDSHLRRSFCPQLNNISNIVEALNSPSIKSLCINDSPFVSANDFPEVCKLLAQAFESKYPDKSSFEL